MKPFRLLLIALFAQLTILPANAQNRIGVVAGLNLANLSSDDLNHASFRAGFGVGGVLDLTLNERVSLCFEPMYLQKGSDLAGEFGSFVWKLDYIELPMMLKLGLSTSTTQPYLMAGPTIGFKISAKLADMNTDNIVENLDFGLGFGAGVSFKAGHHSIFLESRYILGLRDITNGDLELVDEGIRTIIDEVKTRGLQIMAGITFPLNW